MHERFQVITSAQNPRLKSLVRLREARHRRRAGFFLVEGERELDRAIRASWQLETVFFCPELFGLPNAMDVVEAAIGAGAEAVQLSAEAFAKVAYRESPDGLLGLARIRTAALADLPVASPAFVVVAVQIEKPGNLGALMRTANAAGAHALVLCEPVCDPFNPNAIRASQGAFFDLPFALASSEETLAWLRDRAIVAVATTPHADDLLWDLDLAAPVAIVVGAEDRGLSEAWLGNETRAARLPMEGLTDSLNVSVAAGVALFEVVRQRRDRS